MKSYRLFFPQLWLIHFKYLFVYLQRLSSLASWQKWQHTCATQASSLCEGRENIQIHISSGRRSHYEIASLLSSWNGTRDNGLLKNQYREERSHTLKIKETKCTEFAQSAYTTQRPGISFLLLTSTQFIHNRDHTPKFWNHNKKHQQRNLKNISNCAGFIG